MKPNRWPKRIWQYDRETGTDAWFNDVSYILNFIGMNTEADIEGIVDLGNAEKYLLNHSKRIWQLEAGTKRKLRTFVQIHDFNSDSVVAGSNLTRVQRSLVIKYKSGVLPLRLETGRYKGLKEELRVCEVCKCGEVEDEKHFSYRCEALANVRDKWKKANENIRQALSEKDKFQATKNLLTKEQLKSFACWLEEMYCERKSILYK